MAKEVKMADIAKRLGVSTVTVSKALSGQKGVSDKLREEIRQLAREMGYKSPGSGKQGEGQSYHFGVLMAGIYGEKYQSFYWEFYQKINAAAGRKNAFVILELLQEREEERQELPKILTEGKVDGLLILGSISTPYLKMLERECRVPVVYLDFYDRKAPRDCVISNSFYGAYALTEYLFEQGHENIGFVGTVQATQSISDRYLGYVKAMTEHQKKVREDWVIPDREGAAVLLEELSLPEELPTAFVCNCDLAAYQMLKTLEGKGLRVPEDVSLAGYDDYLYPGLCPIGMTTYSVDMEHMAEKGVRTLLKRITSERADFGMEIVEGRLVIRDSVKCMKKFVPASHPSLSYMGRTDPDGADGVTMTYPASCVRMRFTGRMLEAEVTNRRSYFTSYMGYLLDGKEEKIRLEDGRNRIVIAEELSEGEHEICFFKRMDSCHMVTLHGFWIGAGGEVLDPPKEPERRIEVYGDSVSAGEVSEAVHCCGQPDPESDGEYSNSYYSYSWLTARKLQASLHDIAQGGIALLDGTGYCSMPDTLGMESVWDKTQYMPGLCEPKEWDFARYVPQVVILAFGQNDNHPENYMKEDTGGEKAKNWKNRYCSFIRGILEKYPAAHVICTTTIMCHDFCWDEAIRECVETIGSKQVHHFLYSNNGTGTPGHIRIPEAEKMAQELSAYIEQLNRQYAFWR